MKSFGLRAAVVFLIAWALGAAPVWAQATEAGSARLVVTVRDNWGVLPGALVTLSTGATTVSAAADGEGRAEFSGLRPGEYRARASLAGFAESPTRAVTLDAGSEATLVLELTQVQLSAEVTVTTPNRREETLLNVADSMVLIDRTQIEDISARSAKDVLLDQAGNGVQVNQGGGQGHVSINGIPNSGVLVLVDGRRVLGKDANGNFNLEDFDMSAVDRVEVVRGSGSALYGADALGGVINIVTRKSLPGLTNALSLRAGSFGDQRISDTVGWRGSRMGASLSGGYREYDGFDLSAANPQTIGQPESIWRTAAFNGDLQATGWLQVRLVADYLRRDIDNYFFSGPTQLPSTVYNSQRKLTRQGATPEANVLVGANTAFTITYNYGKYDRRESQIYSNRIVPVLPWIEWNNEVKLVGRQTWRAWQAPQYLQAGYEHRRETLERASLRFPETGQRKARRDVDVMWLQQEFTLTPSLKVSAGFRYDRYSDFGDRWSPKASAVYSLGDAQRLRFTIGQGFRAPFFNELYLNTPSFVGNPDLRPERSTTWTAGYVWSDARLSASFDYFDALIENGITFDLSKFPFTYGNLREYSSRGFNTSLSVTLPYGFVPQVSYSLTTREDQEGRTVGGLPKHAGYVKVLWSRPAWGLRANLRGQMLGQATFEDGTAQPAYSLWGAQVSKRFGAASRRGLSVFAQVDNIFDRTDIFRLSASGEPIPGEYQVWAPPRAFSTGITIDLGR